MRRAGSPSPMSPAALWQHFNVEDFESLRSIGARPLRDDHEIVGRKYLREGVDIPYWENTRRIMELGRQTSNVVPFANGDDVLDEGFAVVREALSDCVLV